MTDSQEKAQPEDAERVEVGGEEAEAEFAGCGGKVRVSERGNRDYAWYYLTNNSDSDATVTIRRSWTYNGERRSETKQHRLYPGEDKEVFSFPRNQDPACSITNCRLDD